MSTLKQLETLVQVAETANFGRAGSALGVAQPTISCTIRLLEEQFGRRLFDRSSRTAVLNADGHDLLSRAKRLLHQRDDIERLLAGSPSLAPVMISVAVPELIAATWLQRWVCAARGHYPQARL